MATICAKFKESTWRKTDGFTVDESTEAHEEAEPEHMDASSESKEDFSMNAPASPEEAEALFES